MPAKSVDSTPNTNASIIPAQGSVLSDYFGETIDANDLQNDDQIDPPQLVNHEEEELEEDDVDAQLSEDSEDSPPRPELPPVASMPKRPKPKDGKGFTYVTVPVDEDKDPHDELTQHVPTTFINEKGRRILPRRQKGFKATTNDSDENSEEIGITVTRVAVLARADTQTPQTYLQARKSGGWPEWQIAIIEELRKMDKYDVWEVVTRTKDMRILRVKWVFTRKIDGSTGLPSTFKARWVAKGFHQIEGVDFNEIFSSVAHKDSIRVFFWQWLIISTSSATRLILSLRF